MIVLVILLLIAAVFFLTSYICYRMTFHVPPATQELHHFPTGKQFTAVLPQLTALADAAAAIPCREVETVSHDGLRLHARLYTLHPDGPVQILVHGYCGSALRDFCGGLPLALDSGCNVLLIDQRAHGKSEGKCLTFGILERLDCLTWIAFVRENFGEDTPIFLTGISMGAATVLMTADLDLPDNVRGIIADCGYTSPSEIIRLVMRQFHYPVFPLFFFVRVGARLYGHFSLNECSVPETLRSCHIPVLLIHGEDDRFVPCEMSRINYDACASEKELFLVPGAGHGLSYVQDRDGYTAAVQSFIKMVLGPESVSHDR